ncbi:metallopeptidase family protein [Naumannella halotolerans]|uniref:Zinicin-like metallopeptidase n=1 Tax=Naumannella halotolerans TaxID=993414 RepID=A0A4R7JCC4_9ACTN|nr:metallopeptidase family protein [Naumannella halotolerans]TDT34099.1 zinicin-like metallopeptidase [Naumannella halotolerans]
MRRDRHERGLRGPLAAPNPLTAQPVTPRQPPGRTAFFDDVVAASLRLIRRNCPQALAGVEIGVVDVPEITAAWTDPEPPVAAAVEATVTTRAKVVLYRRPLEHRSASRADLRVLVHRALVEQLSALTTISVREIDPELDED